MPFRLSQTSSLAIAVACSVLIAVLLSTVTRDHHLHRQQQQQTTESTSFRLPASQTLSKLVESLVRPLDAVMSTLQDLHLSHGATLGQEGRRGEVYFLSHGGPPTLFETDAPPHQAWQDFGKLVNEVQPRGLVVVSAHWEHESQGAAVKVNVDSTNPLIYDFYNFPKHFYEQTFESKGDAKMLQAVQEALEAGGVEVQGEKRGLDHGAWVPFKVAFKGKTSIPIVQISLPGDGSPISAAKLGKALAPLRDQGYAIVGTGQVVHNLRDLFSGGDLSYTEPFLSATQSAVHSSSDALQSTVDLFRHPLFKQAHPTPEHFMPLIVAVAATTATTATVDGQPQSEVEDLYVGSHGNFGGGKAGLGWGMWRWK